jgi:hypothetical protein
MPGNPARSLRRDRRPKPKVIGISIDGSALTTTTADAGVIGGLDICQAKDDGSNTVTITFREPLRNAEYQVVTQCHTADAVVDTVTKAAATITYTTVQNDATGSAVADADVDLIIFYNDDNGSMVR